MKRLVIFLLFLFSTNGFCQTAEEQVFLVKSRLDSIETFLADIQLHVDISFIKMPDKEAQAVFNKGEDINSVAELAGRLISRKLPFDVNGAGRNCHV